MNANAKFTLQNLGALAVARDPCRRPRPDKRCPNLAIRPRGDHMPAALGRAREPSPRVPPCMAVSIQVKSEPLAQCVMLWMLLSPVPACRPHQRKWSNLLPSGCFSALFIRKSRVVPLCVPVGAYDNISKTQELNCLLFCCTPRTRARLIFVHTLGLLAEHAFSK